MGYAFLMSENEAAVRAARVAAEPLAHVGSGSSRSGFGTIASFRDIWSHRELLGLLVRREIKARYKDSSLGLVWSLFRPLAQLLVYYFAIGEVLGVARQIPSFAIFVFVGLTTWGLFTEAVSSSTMSIVNNSGLVKKVYLPREIFPLSSIGGALFNFAVQFVVLLAAILLLQEFPMSFDLLFAPLSLAVILAWGTAIGLLLAALNVYLRDIQHLIEVLLVVLFWCSPIVYSFTFVHDMLNGNWLEQLYLANPVTVAILGMQRALWSAGAADPSNWPPDLDLRLWLMLGIGVIALWAAQRVFSRLQGNFAQEL